MKDKLAVHDGKPVVSKRMSGLELMSRYVKAFRKVFNNLDQVLKIKIKN